MRLELLTALTEETGPFLTVSSDVSRVDVAGAREVELRWEAAARELTAAGAPPEVVGQVGELVTARTGRSGRVGRLVVATRDRVVLDLVLPEPPPRDHARWGQLPCLLPVFRSLSSTTRYAVARVDRSGADVEVVGLLGQTTQAETVTGTDDVVHKVPGGGWAQRRYQARVEDSWQHNASAVARELDGIVRRDRPQLVLLEGDEQAMTLLQEHAGHELASRLVRLRTGGRADGTSPEAEQEAITAAVVQHVRQQRQPLVERFAGALARQQEGVDGRAAVVDALRRGQVEELLLHDDPGSEATLWAGEAPLQIGRLPRGRGHRRCPRAAEGAGRRRPRLGGRVVRGRGHHARPGRPAADRAVRRAAAVVRPVDAARRCAEHARARPGPGQRRPLTVSRIIAGRPPGCRAAVPARGQASG